MTRMPIHRLALAERCYELGDGDSLSALALAADAAWAKLTPAQRARWLERARERETASR